MDAANPNAKTLPEYLDATPRFRTDLYSQPYDGEKWGVYLDSVPEEELAVVLAFPEGAVPPTNSRFELLLGAKEHEMHHRGQLMQVERMIGIVPHLTRARQQRQQQ